MPRLSSLESWDQAFLSLFCQPRVQAALRLFQKQLSQCALLAVAFPKAVRHAVKHAFVDGFQSHGHGLLDYLVLQHGFPDDPGGVPGARLFAHRGLLPSGQLDAVGFHPPLQDGFSSWTTTMLFSRLCYAACILATPGFTVLEIDGRAQTRLEPLRQHPASVLATT